MSLISTLSKSLTLTRLLIRYVENWPDVLKTALMNRRTRNVKVIFKGCGQLFFKDLFTLYQLLTLLEKGWNIKDCYDDGTILLCKEVCLKVRTRKGYDIGHVDEIYEKQVYGSNFSGVVIDIGASNADSSIFFAIKGAQKVIALEPFPESYELGKFNVEVNDLTNKVILLPYALADHDGITEFNISADNPNANSINPSEYIKESGVAFDGKIRVQTVTLTTIMYKYDINRIELLKMDCEGCEYTVLRNLPGDVLDAVDKIILEYHNYPREIPSILQKSGFKVKYEEKPTGILVAQRPIEPSPYQEEC